MTKFYAALMVLAAIFTFSGSSRAEIWTPPETTIMLQPGGGSSEPWGIPGGPTGWLPGMELDVPGANYFKNATLDSYVDDGCECQLWAPLVDPVQSKRGYSVVGIMSVGAWWNDNLTQFCLTATTATTVNLEACPPGVYGEGNSYVNPLLNQEWYWKSEDGNTLSELVNFANGKCLTVQNDSTSNGALLVLSTCNGSKSQIVWPPFFCSPWDGIDFGDCNQDPDIILD